MLLNVTGPPSFFLFVPLYSPVTPRLCFLSQEGGEEEEEQPQLSVGWNKTVINVSG